MAAESEAAAAESEQQCAICLIAEPRYSSCGHPFCESCMHAYVMSKLAEQHNRGVFDEAAIPCPICQQSFLPEEIDAAIGDELPGEHSLSKFLLEEAKKLPSWKPAEVSSCRCWCHVVLLLLTAVVYMYALCSEDYLVLLSATAIAVPYLWVSPIVTSRELTTWMDGEPQDG